MFTETKILVLFLPDTKWWRIIQMSLTCDTTKPATLFPNDPNFLIESKGIYRISDLSRLTYFKIPESFGVDPFHDLDEGVTLLLIKHVINNVVESGLMTKEGVTNRITDFNFGILDRNYKIFDLRHLSGVQTRNLIVRLNFMLHDIGLDPKVYEAISVMSRITQYCYSFTFTSSAVQQLDEMIHQFLKIWVQDLDQEVTPKCHHMLHYANVILLRNPYYHLCWMRPDY